MTSESRSRRTAAALNRRFEALVFDSDGTAVPDRASDAAHGRLDEAVQMLGIATRIDLDDLIDQTAVGLHLATMGSVWQALAFGFLGLCVTGDTLAVDPVVPSTWSKLEMRFRYRGTRITTRVEPERLTIFVDRLQRVFVAGHIAIADSKGTTFQRSRAERGTR